MDLSLIIIALLVLIIVVLSINYWENHKESCLMNFKIGYYEERFKNNDISHVKNLTYEEVIKN